MRRTIPPSYLHYYKKKENLTNLLTKEENNIKKCLTTPTEPTTDTATSTAEENGNPEGDLDFGDLEALFQKVELEKT